MQIPSTFTAGWISPVNVEFLDRNGDLDLSYINTTWYPGAAFGLPDESVVIRVTQAGSVRVLVLPKGTPLTQGMNVSGDRVEIFADDLLLQFASVFDSPVAPSSSIVLTNVAGTGGATLTVVVSPPTQLSPSVPATDVNPTVAGTLLTSGSIACFAAGTCIATTTGYVAVEALRIGDRVTTPWGGAFPIVWLGHRRVDCRRHKRPVDVWPVRVRAHAFGTRMPERDLYLSPDHAVFVAADGARSILIPIRHLVNGSSVVQEQVAEITYWHVELACHAILLAEGLPTESYLDTGNRSAFVEAEDAVTLHPDFAARLWNENACAPHVSSGPLLEAVRNRLAAMLPAIERAA